MYHMDVHTDHPSAVLTHCARLAAVVRSWSQAMAMSDKGANLDPDDFEGLAILAGELEATLTAAERHVQQECACFKTATRPQPVRWAWPMTTRV